MGDAYTQHETDRKQWSDQMQKDTAKAKADREQWLEDRKESRELRSRLNAVAGRLEKWLDQAENFTGGTE